MSSGTHINARTRGLPSRTLHFNDMIKCYSLHPSVVSMLRLISMHTASVPEAAPIVHKMSAQSVRHLIMHFLIQQMHSRCYGHTYTVTTNQIWDIHTVH